MATESKEHTLIPGVYEGLRMDTETTNRIRPSRSSGRGVFLGTVLWCSTWRTHTMQMGHTVDREIYL